MTRTITISPVTRLEGHGKIHIVLDEAGDVSDCFFQVVELRGFEELLRGRPAEELPRITPKICGVCPGAHHIASARALDALYHADPPPPAHKLRELFLCAHIAHSHILAFFALGAPDFLPGADAPAARRNLLGLVEALGPELGRRVLGARGRCQEIQGLIGGHPIHPVAALPGGMSKPLGQEERDAIRAWADELVGLAETALELFRDRVLGTSALRALLEGDLYRCETSYAGLVDAQGNAAYYGGRVRVVGPTGAEVALFDGADYLDHIAERVVPWSYMKVPYLRALGYAGLEDGPASGVYRVNSLARLNVARGMPTPRAGAAHDELYATLGSKPVHHTLAFHWARLVELLCCCERMQELAADPEITSTDLRSSRLGKPDAGVGVVEAARGTLYHHYETDARGVIKNANLIVATVQNSAAMGISVKRAAEGLIKAGAADESILNRVEMAFRAYDPCLACATHAQPGQPAIEVCIHKKGGVVRRIRRPRGSLPR
jgi:F420-non-reducing hydrogenase large subunit